MSREEKIISHQDYSQRQLTVGCVVAFAFAWLSAYAGTVALEGAAIFYALSISSIAIGVIIAFEWWGGRSA